MKYTSLKATKCEACQLQAFARFHGQPFCKRHYMHMYHNGRILDRTIFEPNTWEILADYAVCTTYDKSGRASGIVKVDLDKVVKLQNFKVYCRTNNGKKYACITVDKKKVLLHRYLMKVYNTKYTLNKTIDHINGDSLDNRLINLRICSQKDNMKNIHKRDKITGVNQLKDGRWVARLMFNYYTWNLGIFNSKEEAILARLSKEEELFGNFGPNQNMYYLLKHPSPLLEGV